MLNKKCWKRDAQSALWSARTGPQADPRTKRASQMGAKRLPKESPKRSFSGTAKKNCKCEEKPLFTTLQAHPPPQKSMIFGTKTIKKTCWKKGAGKEVPKASFGAPWGTPGRPEEPNWIPTGVQKDPKNELKIVFFGVLGRRCENRGPRSSPKRSRGTPQAQNRAKIDQKWTEKRSHKFKRSRSTLRAAPRLERSSSTP